jgi:hypothetical protein
MRAGSTSTFGLSHDYSVILLTTTIPVFIRFEAEDAGRKPGDESLPSRRLGWRSQIGFLIC